MSENGLETVSEQRDTRRDTPLFSGRYTYSTVLTVEIARSMVVSKRTLAVQYNVLSLFGPDGRPRMERWGQTKLV